MKKKVKKDFNYIWEIIEISIYIVVGYSILDMAFSVSTYVNKVIPAGIFSILLTVFAFGLIGYKAVRQKEEPSQIARYGAYAGAIVGLASAIIGFVIFYFYPEKIAAALQQAAQAGADTAMIQSVMKIMIYVNFVLSPAINAGIGALFAWISGLIFKKK